MTSILDASALLALFREEPGAADVDLMIRRGDCAVTAVNVAETLDVLQRVYGLSRHEAEDLVDLVVGGHAVRCRDVDLRMAQRAAALRARHYEGRSAALSLADCVLLAAAEDGDEVVTGDRAVIDAARADGVASVALAG